MLALTTLALAAAPATFGSHSFPDDVPDTHPFHNEIGIFKGHEHHRRLFGDSLLPERLRAPPGHGGFN